MNLKPLEHTIYCLDVEYLQPGVACLYLLAHQGQLCIIETGTTLSVPLVEQAIARIGLHFSDVAYIIPTHIHLDHAGGAGALMQRCPQARLVIHPRGAAHMADPNRLIAGTIQVYGEQNYRRLYGEVIAVAEHRMVIAEDGFELDLNGRMLDFIDTPGHALHHFCVVDRMSRGVFSGDTFGIAYPQLATHQGPFIFATTTPTQFDPDALLASIDKVLTHKIKKLYLTHFGEVAASPRLIHPLKQSVQDQAALALAEQGRATGRVERLQDAILEQMLAALREQGGERAQAWYQRQLAPDCRLNAQGLDAWLRRLEKAN